MVGQDEEQTKKTHGHDLAKKNRSLKKMSHFSEILEDTQKKNSIWELQLFTNIKVIHT